jgi:uncharacterized protein (TIGR02646 family)
VQFQRQEKPQKQKRYQDYKQYLRRDFLFRCAYCLIHEAHHGGLRNFHVDHFRPKKKFRRLTLVYENLYYACSLCNTFKGDLWPSGQQLRAGFKFVDPCDADPYRMHFEEEQDGTLRVLTNAGRYTVDHLRLNRRQLQKYRLMLIEARQKCEEIRSLLGSPGLPVELAARAQEILKQVERMYIAPTPPYEVEDLYP